VKRALSFITLVRITVLSLDIPLALASGRKCYEKELKRHLFL